MEEEGGEEDTEHVERGSDSKEKLKYIKMRYEIIVIVEPDPPDHITDCADCDV